MGLGVFLGRGRCWNFGLGISKMKKKKWNVKWKVLAGSLAVVYLMAFIGSLATTQGVATGWYESIKPRITPPNWVFPVVWNILFFLIGLSLYFAWINSKKKDRWKIDLVFGINLFLNVLWSFLFFGLRNPAGSFYELILLWFSIAFMIYVVGKVDKLAGWLLVPYLVWVSFAGVLNWLMVFG